MYPLLLSSFGFVVDMVCPRHMVERLPCVCVVVFAFLPGSLGGFALWTCRSPKGTQHDGFGCGVVGVICAQRVGAP